MHLNIILVYNPTNPGLCASILIRSDAGVRANGGNAKYWFDLIFLVCLAVNLHLDIILYTQLLDNNVMYEMFHLHLLWSLLGPYAALCLFLQIFGVQGLANQILSSISSFTHPLHSFVPVGGTTLGSKKAKAACQLSQNFLTKPTLQKFSSFSIPISYTEFVCWQTACNDCCPVLHCS